MVITILWSNSLNFDLGFFLLLQIYISKPHLYDWQTCIMHIIREERQRIENVLKARETYPTIF